MPDKTEVVKTGHEMLIEVFETYDLGNNPATLVTLRDTCVAILQDVTNQIPDLWDPPLRMAEGIEREKLRDILTKNEPKYENWFAILRYAKTEIVHRVEESRKAEKKKKKWWQ